MGDLATEKQRDFLTSLRVDIPSGLTKETASGLISAALAKQKAEESNPALRYRGLLDKGPDYGYAKEYARDCEITLTESKRELREEWEGEVIDLAVELGLKPELSVAKIKLHLGDDEYAYYYGRDGVYKSAVASKMDKKKPVANENAGDRVIEINVIHVLLVIILLVFILWIVF